MKRLAPWRGLPVLFVWLVILWVMLWSDLSVANVIGGIGVAIVVLVAVRTSGGRTHDEAEADPVRLSPLGLIRLAGVFTYQLVTSNLVLAREVVTPRNRINSGIIAVPLRTDSEAVMLVITSIITLTPGTLVLEAKGSPPVLYVNVLHLHDLEAVRRDLLALEVLTVRAFGTRSARAQLAEQGSVA